MSLLHPVVQAGRSVLETALTGVAQATLAGGLLLLIAARPWRGRGHAGSALGPPLALSTAALAGFRATRGWPDFPPHQALDWVFALLLVTGAVALLEVRTGRVASLPRGLVAVLAPFLLLEFQRRLHWGRVEGILWTGGLAALLFASWSLLSRLEERRRTPTWAWTFGALPLAAALGLAGGGLLAQLPIAILPVLFLCALLGAWRRSSGLGRAGVGPYLVLHHALVWAGHYLYELTTAGFVLLLVAPLGTLAGEFAPPSRPRLRAALALVTPLALGLVACALERQASPPSPYG